jgi:hypothetical protein
MAKQVFTVREDDVLGVARNRRARRGPHRKHRGEHEADDGFHDTIPDNASGVPCPCSGQTLHAHDRVSAQALRCDAEASLSHRPGPL